MADEKSNLDKAKDVAKDIASDVKDEAKDTFKNIKRTMSNTDIKGDAKKTTKHITSLFRDPIDTFDSIANSKRNTSFKIAIFIIIFWTAINLVGTVGEQEWAWGMVFKNILGILGSLLKPLCSILILSIITLIYERSTNKNLARSITVLTFAQVPLVIGSLFKLIDLFSTTAHYVTDPLLQFTAVVSLVFTYLASRSLLKETNETSTVKTFALIQGLYFAILIVLGFFNIGLYLI